MHYNDYHLKAIYKLPDTLEYRWPERPSRPICPSFSISAMVSTNTSSLLDPLVAIHRPVRAYVLRHAEVTSTLARSHVVQRLDPSGNWNGIEVGL